MDGESIVPLWYRLEYVNMPEKREDLAKLFLEDSTTENDTLEKSEKSKCSPLKFKTANSVISSDSVYVSCLSEESNSILCPELKEDILNKRDQEHKAEDEKEKEALRRMSVSELLEEYKKSLLESERLECLWEDLQKERELKKK